MVPAFQRLHTVSRTLLDCLRCSPCLASAGPKRFCVRSLTLSGGGKWLRERGDCFVAVAYLSHTFVGREEEQPYEYGRIKCDK